MGDSIFGETTPWMPGWGRQQGDPQCRVGNGRAGGESFMDVVTRSYFGPPMMCLSPQAPAARYAWSVVPVTPYKFTLTAELLQSMVSKMKAETAQAYVAPLNQYLNRYDINTPGRVAAFIGQVATESGNFKRTVENLNYKSAERLHKIFPGRFPTVESAEDYVGKPEKIANKIYSKKLDNGDEASGDGWTFRGRGLIQLTGRANYKAFMDATKVDVMSHPELLEQPSYAVYSATWFWDSKGLNALADAEQFKKLTKRINAAGLGYEEREAARKHALAVLAKSDIFKK